LFYLSLLYISVTVVHYGTPVLQMRGKFYNLMMIMLDCCSSGSHHIAF